MVNGDGHQAIPAKKESDKEFWERRYVQPLSDADVEEIRTNLLSLAEFLIEISGPHAEGKDSL